MEETGLPLYLDKKIELTDYLIQKSVMLLDNSIQKETFTTDFTAVKISWRTYCING